MVLGIFGASGLGREILETARLCNQTENKYSKIIFVDDNPNLTCVQDIEVYGLVKAYEIFSDEGMELVLAIGEPSTRLKVIEKVHAMGLEFCTLIHPSVTIPDSTKIGKGCYIAPFSFISCNVTIGDYCLIQPNVNVGHDCVLEKNVSVCGMTTLGGACHIGENTFIAMGVAVIQGCTIGKECVIGLGAAVHKDIPESMVALGNPARPMKNNDEHKVFK